MNVIKYTLLILSLLFLMNCSDARKGFSLMYELDGAIADKYDFEDIELKLRNKSELTVNINYSDVEELNGREMAEIAKEIGEMVSDLEGAIKTIEEGTVKFTKKEDYGILQKSETESYQMF